MLSVTGGDLYISVMTIVSSIRQMVETPIYAIVEGSSPVLSYNYGAKRPARVRKSIFTMGLLVLLYTAVMWSVIILAPHALIAIFSSDSTLMDDAVKALNIYFAAFIFMDLQYIGQTTFKSLNKKKRAIFFSLLRKVFIVVPLTYILPYSFGMGTDGVFMAEPVSNVIGGSICFVTMLGTVLPAVSYTHLDVYKRQVYVIVPSALSYSIFIVSPVHFVPLIFAFVNPASLTAASAPVPNTVLLNVTVTLVAVAEAATSSSA